MRFLRIKPRGSTGVAKVGASAEEEEEGRQGLLPDTPSCNQYVELELPTLQTPTIQRTPSNNALVCTQQEQAACTTEIVTLKAFIHCQGCARKVKKTLSKLQGVNTFHVDADQQKVTVIGSVCAEEVLQSVNKVLKGTELWAAPKNKPNSSSHALP